MVESDRTSSLAPRASSITSRRKFLALTGAAGSMGLAGCIGSSGSNTETVTIASLNPMSGPYSALGPEHRAGVELAVQKINESDEFSYEVDPVYYDTESEAGAGSSAMQQAIQQDDADFVFGAISSSVSLALEEIAVDSEVVYFPGGAAVPITGVKCNPWTFRFETTTAQAAEAVSEFTINELGSNVWFHIADYAYGDSVYKRTKKRMEAADAEFNEVGKTASSLGSTNFESYISQIRNSDADAVMIGMVGLDLANFINQAADRGLKDDVNLIAPGAGFKSTRGATGANSVGVYSGVRYHHAPDLGDNHEFVDAFKSENDGELPGDYERVGYESFRLIARGMEKADSADPADVRDALEGGTFTTVLGDITLREADHQATVPVWSGKLVEGDGDMAAVKLLQKVEGEDALPPASELGCER